MLLPTQLPYMSWLFPILVFPPGTGPPFHFSAWSSYIAKISKCIVVEGTKSYLLPSETLEEEQHPYVMGSVSYVWLK